MCSYTPYTHPSHTLFFSPSNVHTHMYLYLPHTQLGLFNGRIWPLRPTRPLPNIQLWKQRRPSIHSHTLYGNSPAPKKVSILWRTLSVVWFLHNVHTVMYMYVWHCWWEVLCMQLTISQSLWSYPILVYLVDPRTLTPFTRQFCHWRCTCGLQNVLHVWKTHIEWATWA